MLRGIKLDSNKEISITSEIVDASFPNKVYIPLINNITTKLNKILNNIENTLFILSP